MLRKKFEEYSQDIIQENEGREELLNIQDIELPRISNLLDELWDRMDKLDLSRFRDESISIDMSMQDIKSNISSILSSINWILYKGKP